MNLPLLHKLENNRIKVGAYARISRDKADLENSLETQIRYYTTLINANPTWEYAGIYADDGITGSSIKKRNQFQLMLTKAFAKEIDVILVKSISRFARNAIDLISTVQELRSAGVEVYFEKEGISTLDTASDVYLSMYSKFAEDELQSMSRNVLWSLEKKMEKGSFYLDASRMFGFMFDENRKVIINEKEAVWVRTIFQMYSEGINTALIADYLERNGIKTITGNTRWSSSSIRNMIRNEKYYGDVILQKTYSNGPLSQKQLINKGEKEKYLIPNALPAIVSRQLWDKCQQVMKTKAGFYHVGAKNTRNLETAYTRFGWCPYCRNNYFRKLNKKREMLVCSSNKNRLSCKESESVFVEHLNSIIPLLVKKLKANENEFKKDLIKEFAGSSSSMFQDEIDALNKEIDCFRAKIKEYNKFDNEAFNALKNELNKNIETIQNQIMILENERIQSINPVARAESIISELRKFPDGELGNYNFRKLFKKLIIINRDRLIFVIGSDNMDKIPLNPNTITMSYIESITYVIRSTRYDCHFGIYINK